MSRKRRIEFPGALYHVKARGNHGAPVFLNDDDKRKFLSKLKDYKEKYNFAVYAYSLFENHFHLLIETDLVPLSRIMQGLMQSYTQWFNKQHETEGHLFQGRYKAVLCDKESLLLSLISYIHLKCVLTGAVQDHSLYEWSSHKIYISTQKSGIVDKDKVLQRFDPDPEVAKQKYIEFILESAVNEKDASLDISSDGIILGNEEFIEQVKRTQGRNIVTQTEKNKTLDEVADMTEKITGIPVFDLKGIKRRNEIVGARALFVRLALHFTASKRKDIAQYLNRVPRNIPHLERKIRDDVFAKCLRSLSRPL